MDDVFRKSIKSEECEDHAAWSGQEPDPSNDGEDVAEDASDSHDAALIDGDGQKDYGDSTYVGSDEPEYQHTDYHLSVLPTLRKRTLSCR